MRGDCIARFVLRFRGRGVSGRGEVMRRLLRLQCGSVLLIACSLLRLTETVRADERTDARREFRAGMQNVADGKYDEGLDHLERAYEILPHPNVLYNIGLAHMYAGRAAIALEYFQRYRETVSDSDAVEVESLIASLAAASTVHDERAEPPAVGPVQSGAELGQDEVARALEAAAREVRRLSVEQNSEALRAQADDLDRSLSLVRRQNTSPAASSEPVTAPARELPNDLPQPEGQIAQQTPPAQLPGSSVARQGVYEEQVVSASRFSQSPLDAPNATAIITSQDIRMAGQTSLTNLLRRIAGLEVTTVAPTHSEVSIRGLNRRSANKLLFLWDGRPIRKEFVGTNWPDTLPISLEDVERIEIIRGPASALYGADAFSGIINIITRAPGTGKSFVVGRYGNRKQGVASGSFMGRVGRASYRFGVSLTTQENSVLLVDPDRLDVRPFSDSPEKSNFGTQVNGEVTYPLAKSTMLSVGGSLNVGDNTIQGISRVGQTVVDDSYEGYAFASLTLPKGFRVGTWFNETMAISDSGYYTPGSLFRPRQELNQHQYEADVSWTDTLDLLVPQTLTLGATYRWKQLVWERFADEQPQHHAGAYLQDLIQLAKPLRLQLGARVDYHPLLTNVQFSPRGSLVYRFYGEQSLRLSAGRAFRGPSFLESYLQSASETPLRAVSAWGLGNDKLDPESITSVELGYQNQASDYFSLEANVYFNLVKNAILLTNVDRYTLRDYAGRNPLAAYDSESDAFPVSGLRYANERATYQQLGGELGVRFYPIKGLDVYTNYSIHDTSPTDEAKVDPVRAEEEQTSLHKVNGGVQYRAPIGLELSADVSWVAGQTWVEQVIDTERGVRWQAYDVDPFVMLSARIGWRLFRERLELGLVGNNLAFQHQRQHPLGQPLDTRVIGTAKVWF
jgi:outer membrane receptor for ferrienterochelin and colicin